MFAAHCFQRRDGGFALQHHASAPAKRQVVGRAVLVSGEIADVGAVRAHERRVARFTDEARGERGVEKLGEQREDLDVKAHSLTVHSSSGNRCT